MMRFDITFDDTLRDGSSFGNVNSQIHCITFSLLLVLFKLKGQFSDKNICGNTCTRGFMGLLNQVLAFVTFFS